MMRRRSLAATFVRPALLTSLAFFLPLATAQEWGGGRGEYMHQLREACEFGDDRACWRLRHMRDEWRQQHEWREQHDENRGGWDGPGERAPY